MRKFLISLLLPILFAGFTAFDSRADVNVGIAADKDGIREFHLSIGTHYGVKEREIEKVRARSLPDDEMAVVFFLSSRTGISPVVLVDLRLGGISWMDITFRYGLTAELYYVRFASDPGPPYGNAWGHYKKIPRKKWGKIQLADDDIINLVNLKFLAEKHQCSPEKIVRMKKQGKSFANMHTEFKKAKAEKEQKKAIAKKSSDGKAKGKKGKGKK
ncbi:MAG: hypothetical protein JSU85_09510 [Candidatus Zixiibacteriota bacterium]|nr:MAG: hypothetical protein JSU85_09510 [candidate division Zixibacteria bacterium]